MISANKALHSAVIGFGILAACLDSAFAQDIDPLDSGDTAWMMTSTALVLFMAIPGLSLFYAGMVRSKNALSIMMQCFAITCLITLLWFAYGYSLAFDEGGAWIGGMGKLFLAGVTVDSLSGHHSGNRFFHFPDDFRHHHAGVDRRCVRGTHALFRNAAVHGLVVYALVYVPVAHWVWGGGWLAEMGVLDFAGGTVVHINAGIAGLVACVMLGKRKGYPNTAMLPHSLVLTLVGAAMLWVGWFGFNAGSELAADGTAGMAMLVTQIAAAAAALTWMAAEWRTHGKPSALGIASGAVGGLVAITPASGFVGPIGALAIGIAAGIGCYLASVNLKRVLGYDDSLDVFGVHGIGGIIGAILTGVFVDASFGGAGLAEGTTMGAQVFKQIVGVTVTVVYGLILSFVLLKIADLTLGLRVAEEDETEGLDIVLHDERGYNI